MTTPPPVITDHRYQGPADGQFCAYDPGEKDVNFCTMPRSAHKLNSCDGATRQHKHLGEDPETGRLMLDVRLLTPRKTIWVKVPDDGSVCTRDVVPKAPSYIPGTLPHREKVSPNPKKGSRK